MDFAPFANQRRALLAGLATGAALLALLPVLGLVLAYFEPKGLFAPPDRPWIEILALTGKSLAFAFSVASLSVLLGTWLGWLDSRADYPGRRWLCWLTALPLAFPSYLLAGILRDAFAPRGLVGDFLGRERAFSGFGPAVLTLTLICTPLVQLMLGAALTRLPVAEDEAARSLGAGPLRRFLRVLAPRLRSAWVMAFTVVGLYTLSDFGAVATLDCDVLTWEIYKMRGSRTGATLALSLLAVVLPLLGILRRLRSREDLRLGPPRAEGRSLLGWKGRLAAYAVQLPVASLGCGLPGFMLARWIGYGGDRPPLPWGAALGHSLGLAALGSTVALAMAAAALLPLLRSMAPAGHAASFGVARSTASMGLLESAIFLASGLPGVALATGVLHWAASLRRVWPNVAEFLEVSWLAVILGLALRFVSEGYAALAPAVERLDPRHDESARSLGAGPWRRFLRLELPQLLPSALAAFLVLFASMAKELPIVLMLAPPSTPTLAYRIFDAQQEGALMDAGVAGWALLALSAVIHAALWRLRRHG